MRVALSEISTVNASFVEDVAAYAAAGFDAIGLWEMKLPEDDDANLALLRASGLSVANCVPLVPSVLPLAVPGMEEPTDPAARIEAICTSVRRFAAYEPECVACLTGPVGQRAEHEAREIASDGLRQIAAVAREAGVRLGLEPIHPSERETTSFVNSVADAALFLDQAGLGDVGILVDTYNLWDDRGADAWIVDNPARIAGVHVAAHAPGGSGRDLPGRTGRERELVDALRAAGWEGSIDVEIFSAPDGFWSLPVAEAARRAHDAATSLIAD